MRPWENMYQLFQFNRQVMDIMDVIQNTGSYTENQDEDEVKMDCFIEFIRSFLTCGIIIDKHFILNDNPYSSSVLRRRMNYFLSTDSLSAAAKSKQKKSFTAASKTKATSKSKTTGRKKSASTPTTRTRKKK